jgi:endonuclease YncB( thermonuclease family)
MVKEVAMRQKWIVPVFLGLLLSWTGLFPARAGDSTYGKVMEVRSAEVVLLDTGETRYEVRLIGIQAPKEGPLAEEARKLVSELVLGQQVQMRFEGRNKEGEMVARLLTLGDAAKPIRDVGLEVVRAGLARRLPNFDYKYGELSKAEAEARKGRRGLWASASPR